MDTQPIPLTQVDAETTEWIEVAKAVAFGVAAAALVFLAVIGWLTLQNTYATAQNTQSIVRGHNTELSQLKTDETTVVGVGRNLEQTQQVICQGLHLNCPRPG